MSNKHKKRHLASLIVREMQTEPRVRDPLPAPGTVNMKMQVMPRVGRDVEKLGLYTLPGGM